MIEPRLTLLADALSADFYTAAFVTAFLVAFVAAVLTADD